MSEQRPNKDFVFDHMGTCPTCGKGLNSKYPNHCKCVPPFETPPAIKQQSDNIMRTGQQYTLIDFDSAGTIIVKNGKIEISKGIPIDHGEIGLSVHWSGSLKDLARLQRN